MNSYRFKAFISYSHADQAWASWLHKALEGYRVPKHLVGSKGEFGEVPKRVSPVFRDREDLSSASDLSGKVKEALEASETLIVICSPSARKSEWVNEEVRYFHELGRGDRVHAVIVDGDPTSKDPSEQCFPASLVEAPDGSILEPLAADARKWADGRLLAKLKVVSGILGIPLDALRRRDMQRRQRVWIASMAGVMSIAIIMSVLAVTAITARNAAENRREHAEELVGYMVGDLKTKLDEVGRLDILEGMGGRVGEYLESLDPSEVTDDSLNQQAQVWRQLGEVAMNQGNLEEALHSFTISRDILVELERRNPGQAKLLFELGHAAFWVGYVHFDRGDLEKAETEFQAYLGFADQLVTIDRRNPEWLSEKAQAHTNLAGLEGRRGGAERSLIHIDQAIANHRQSLELDPDNATYRSAYEETLAWQADTQLLTCKLGDALISRQESEKIARQEVSRAPGNVNRKLRHALALSGLATVAVRVGLVDLALENYTKSQELLRQLSVLEPTNLDYRFDYLIREANIAALNAEKSELDSALSTFESLRDPLFQVLEEESWQNLERRTSWVNFLIEWSMLADRAGQTDKARELRNDARLQLGSILEADDMDTGIIRGEFQALRFLGWRETGQDLLGSQPFSEHAESLEPAGLGCSARVQNVMVSILEGEQQAASEQAQQLFETGFFHPKFIRMCKEYGIYQEG